MNTAQSFRPANGRRFSRSHEAAAHEVTPAPHIFQPEANARPRDFAALFNLKERPGHYNAAAKAALLRQATRGPRDELFVDFSHSDVQIELKAAGISLISGAWPWQATVGGQPLSTAGDWTEVCWHREETCDYLEIELPLSGGWKLERQAFWARKDRFLLLADALTGPAGAEATEIRYSHSLPVAPNAAFEPARETRDGVLASSGQQRARVVPPALAEWRVEYCHAELSSGEGRLTLQQAAHGRNLYAPLWIDLDPGRRRRPLTWRRLSVGENLAIVPRDVAVGYRIQAGREQWLVYRSLAPVGNRSVLGHNTYADFVCARFMPTGEAKEILAIE
jgi:hypothetical protein